MAVVLNAPAAFRFTGPANPDRHLEAARLLGSEARQGPRPGAKPGRDPGPADAGEALASAVLALMRRLGMPNGLSAVGYGEQDVEALVQGTLPQHRVTRLCPRPFRAEDLAGVFRASLRLW
jgi:hydroxyacid-oxoacid transhydrogenase